MRYAYKALVKRLLAFVIVMTVINCGGGGGDSSENGGQSSSSSPNGSTGGSSNPPAVAPTLIALENAKQGTAAWQLSNPALSHEIEGYASATSLNRGDRIDFMVNTSAASFNVDIYRMGWYGGAGARLMKRYANLSRISQPMPCLNSNGIVECNWHSNLTITVPTADSDPASPGYWASGIYLAKLSTNSSPSKESYIIFVARAVRNVIVQAP